MKRIFSIIAMIMLAGTGLVHAETAPLNLAVFDPIQMVPNTEAVKGVRLSLFYTNNTDVTGLSLVLVGLNRATGDVKGVDLGWMGASWVDGSYYGWQPGLVSRTGKRFVGWQGGVVAVTEGDFTGLQSGLVAWTEGFFHGWQAGWINHTTGRFVGLQTGLLNITQGETSGVQLGAVNWSEGSVKGVQAGLFNYANEVHGLQLGIGNVAKSLDGIQIGLGNYNGKKEPFEFLPFVNWSF